MQVSVSFRWEDDMKSAIPLLICMCLGGCSNLGEEETSGDAYWNARVEATRQALGNDYGSMGGNMGSFNLGPPSSSAIEHAMREGR